MRHFWQILLVLTAKYSVGLQIRSLRHDVLLIRYVYWAIDVSSYDNGLGKFSKTIGCSNSNCL